MLEHRNEERGGWLLGGEAAPNQRNMAANSQNQRICNEGGIRLQRFKLLNDPLAISSVLGGSRTEKARR